MTGKWQATVVMPPHLVPGPGQSRIHALLELTSDEGEDLAVPVNLTNEDMLAFTQDEGFSVPAEAEEAARQLWDWFLAADDGMERKKLHALRHSLGEATVPASRPAMTGL